MNVALTKTLIADLAV